MNVTEQNNINCISQDAGFVRLLDEVRSSDEKVSRALGYLRSVRNPSELSHATKKISRATTVVKDLNKRLKAQKDSLVEKEALIQLQLRISRTICLISEYDSNQIHSARDRKDKSLQYKIHSLSCALKLLKTNLSKQVGSLPSDSEDLFAFNIMGLVDRSWMTFARTMSSPNVKERAQVITELHRTALELSKVCNNPIANLDRMPLFRERTGDLITALDHSLRLCEASMSIADIAQEAATSELNEVHVQDLMKELDAARIRLANVGELRFAAEAQVLEQAKAAARSLSTTLLETETKLMTTTEGTIQSFIAEFLRPYIAGEIDPSTEPERPPLVQQLKSHLNNLKVEIPEDFIEISLRAFIHEGTRALSSIIATNTYRQADHGGMRCEHFKVPRLSMKSPLIPHFSGLMRRALTREFGVGIDPNAVDGEISQALEALPNFLGYQG